MTSTARTKRWLGLAALGVLAATGIAAVLAAAGLMARVSTGADPRDSLTATPMVPEEYEGLTTWIVDDLDLIRPVEPQTRRDLEAMWVRSLGATQIAARTGETEILADWFDGPALATAELAALQRSPVALELQGSQLRVRFYSLDAQIVVLEATSQFLESEQPSVSIVQRSTVVAMLLDGNWRVRHIEAAGNFLTNP